MKICICGGGSLGTICAGVFSSLRDVEVNLLTQHPEKWSHTIKVVDQDNKRYEGKLQLISNDPKIVVKGCDIILLCLPGYLIEETLLRIKPYLEPEMIVGTVVSSTGFFFQAHSLLPNETKLFGFQRVPYIARVMDYGREGALLGYKTSLNVAVENIVGISEFKKTLEYLFLTPVNILNNYYEASLTNSNPILHTGRLYSMWHQWDGKPFGKCSYFYKEWDDTASQIIIDMDYEFMKIVDLLPIRKGAIPTLLDYYESTDKHSLSQKISSIPAFQPILSPMKQIDGGWIPDFASRYFTEDFPFGLRYIKELAELYHVETPMIDRVYNWGMNVMENNF